MSDEEQDKKYVNCIFEIRSVCPVRKEQAERIAIEKKVKNIIKKPSALEDVTELLEAVVGSLDAEYSQLSNFCDMCPYLEKWRKENV